MPPLRSASTITSWITALPRLPSPWVWQCIPVDEDPMSFLSCRIALDVGDSLYSSFTLQSNGPRGFGREIITSKVCKCSKSRRVQKWQSIAASDSIKVSDLFSLRAAWPSGLRRQIRIFKICSLRRRVFKSHCCRILFFLVFLSHSSARPWTFFPYL